MTGELDREAERVLLDTIYCTMGADSWPLEVLTK